MPEEALTSLHAYKVKHSPMMPQDKKGERAYEVWWVCSNCEHELRGGMKDPAVDWKFCPHCGARFGEIPGQ